MTLLLEMFTYPFIVRAFAAGVLLSLCAALLGVPLVLKRYSMIGDGLSHVSFGALSVALACGWAPLPVSIPVVIVAALGLLRMTERSRMGADAAIAVVSASSLAVGVIVRTFISSFDRGSPVATATFSSEHPVSTSAAHKAAAACKSAYPFIFIAPILHNYRSIFRSISRI